MNSAHYFRVVALYGLFDMVLFGGTNAPVGTTMGDAQFLTARGRPEISLFALFSDVAAVGDPGVSHGEKVNFGFVCSPDGWNEASPVPASYPAHANNGVKPLNNGTRQRADT